MLEREPGRWDQPEREPGPVQGQAPGPGRSGQPVAAGAPARRVHWDRPGPAEAPGQQGRGPHWDRRAREAVRARPERPAQQWSAGAAAAPDRRSPWSAAGRSRRQGRSRPARSTGQGVVKSSPTASWRKTYRVTRVTQVPWSAVSACESSATSGAGPGRGVQTDVLGLDCEPHAVTDRQSHFSNRLGSDVGGQSRQQRVQFGGTHPNNPPATSGGLRRTPRRASWGLTLG